MTRLRNITELVVVTCWCGMPHAIPEELRRFQNSEHEDGRDHFVYCPLGHTHAPAGKPRWQREREAREAAERTAAARLAALDQERASHAATKGALTKARRRAAAALCPCCNRSFVQLRRHMAAKHPDYDPAAA